jgi:RES domain-containing protein
VRLYRIARAGHALDLSGEGARLYGGRWTPPGYPVIYTAEHPALAAWEVLVHFGLVAETAPLDHRLVALDVPDHAETMHIPHVPHDPPAVGREWLESGQGLLLCVPSVVIPESRNYLLNPAHPDMAAVVVQELGVFVFDARITSYSP